MAEQIDFLPQLDFSLNICTEKIPNNGEDSGYFCFTSQGGMVAVFDGCGGSGARKYPELQGKTGAYLASRTVCGAVKDWFKELRSGLHAPQDIVSLHDIIAAYIAQCQSDAGDTGCVVIKGSLFRELPTTAAVTLAVPDNNGFTAYNYWCGDSRCYLLDEDGLCQLSFDDVDGLDAMQNLTADGVLTNVISASGKFTLHRNVIRRTITKPSLLFTATDGCFGYFSTPMEFEDLLLSTLMESDRPAQWEEHLNEKLDKIAGDDYTLQAMALGCGNIENWKRYMEPYYRTFQEKYITNLENLGSGEKNQLWKDYKVQYEKYMGEN